MELTRQSFILKSNHASRPFLSDVTYVQNNQKKPLVLFVHGFKGFKDWGHFGLLADSFAGQDVVFLKMNLSHNGTTPDSPLDFADLEAFGNNNYEIEMDDIGVVLDHVVSTGFSVPEAEFDSDKIYLMGHSRGGGVCFLKGAEDLRIKKLITWAPVSDFETFWDSSTMQSWQKAGVHHIFNSRTKQEMPLYYQLIENYERNQARFSIPEAVKRLKIPCLIIHGEDDETVPYQGSTHLTRLQTNLQLYIVPEANHTFGGKHPCTDTALPEHTEIAFNESMKFIKS